MKLARGMLVFLATMLAATACTSEPEPTPTLTPTPTPMVSPTPTPTPSPSPSPSPSPELSPSPTLSPDQQAAVDTVLEYFRIGDEVRGDLEADFQPFADITGGAIQRAHVEEIAENRSQGVIQVGHNRYEIVGVSEPDEVDGDVSVRVRVCSDSTESDLVLQDTGESTLDETRAFHVYWVLDVVHVNSFAWVVSDGGSEVRDPCPQ